MEMSSGQSCALGKVVELPESQMSVCLPASLYVFLFLSNAGCLIITPPKLLIFYLFFWGGVSIPIVNSWNLFSCFLNKGFIRKSAVWQLDQISGI